MRSLIVALIIHLTLNILVFLKGWDAFKGKKGIRIALLVIFGTELLIYTSGLIFHQFLPDEWIHAIRVMGTSWMLFLLYTGGSWLIIDAGYLIWKRQVRRPKYLLQQSQKTKITLFLSAIVVVIGILAYGGYRFKHPVVQQVDIRIEKPVVNIDSVQIAMIGDVHLGYMTTRKNVRDYVNLIMAQQPDLILFVGDILDAHIEPVIQRGLDQELKRLHAPMGVFSCTGNHEYRFEGEEKIQLLNNSGITMLRDSAVLIDDAFYVVGREDFIVPHRLTLPEILKQQNVNPAMPIIVLNHSPHDLSQEVNAGADIALYGHTHHGQAFPGNIATEMVFEVAHGYKKKGNTHIYVTSGLGLVGPRFRVGTVSEIVMLNVKFGV